MNIWSILIPIGVCAIGIAAHYNALDQDRYRIYLHGKEMGWTILERTLVSTPRSYRVYRVKYRDQAGAVHIVIIETYMGYLAVKTDDVLASSSTETAPPDVQSEVERLRARVRELESREKTS